MPVLFRRSKKPPKLCEHQAAAALAAVSASESRHENEEPKASQNVEQASTNPHASLPIQAANEANEPAEKVEPKHPCATCRADQLAARRYRIKMIVGLFFPWALQALDVTIVAGALPFIASDFHQLSQLNWIVTAFNLTAATFIPAWGQFADIFGRHNSLQACMFIMLVGSGLCTGAPVPNGFPMLLVGRALQGIACAGVGVITHVILADKVSLKENAKNNTYFAMFGGLSYAVGPVIGGYLTEASWRWCFGINIPVALIGIVMAYFVLRPELLGPQRIPGVDDEVFSGRATFKIRLTTVDYGGQLLFLFGMGLLIMGLTWGGSYYSWSDPKVIVLIILGAIIFALFVDWEYLMLPGRKLALMFHRQKAMIPMNLVWSRNAGLLIYINFVTGMAMYAVFYFVDIYFVLVLEYPASKAGIQLLYYTPGIGGGVYFAMFACNIWPRKTWYPLALGTMIEAIGITVLAVALNKGHIPTIYGMLALTGAGSGLRFMPGSLHSVGYFPNNIAAIMSLMGLAMSFGGIFAMTLMFTVFNNKLSNAGISFNTSSSSASSFSQIEALPRESIEYFQAKAKDAIVTAFFALSPFLWLGLFAIAGIGNVNITKHGKGLEGDGERDFSENVAKGSYLLGLLRWRKPVNREEPVVETSKVEDGQAQQ